jgi:hypothetical protein
MSKKVFYGARRSIVRTENEVGYRQFDFWQFDVLVGIGRRQVAAALFAATRAGLLAWFFRWARAVLDTGLPFFSWLFGFLLYAFLSKEKILSVERGAGWSWWNRASAALSDPRWL